MASVQGNIAKSHCQPPTPEELERMRQRFRIEKRRFSRAARLSQILYTLTACGPNSMRGIAQIIAGYTGEDPEVVRRILYRHIKLLTDLWFVEKRNAKLRITPLGLYVLATTAKDLMDYWLLPYIPFWIASRLEEWEKALYGLRIFLENLGLLWIEEIAGYYSFDFEYMRALAREEFSRSASTETPNLSERDVLFILLNSSELKELDEDDPVIVLHNLSSAFAPYFVDTHLYELHKDLPEEFERALRRHYRRLREVAALLRSCSRGKCPEGSLEVFIESLFERKGLLLYLEKLDPKFVEKMTGWPQGRPPVPSAIALLVASELLPDWSPGMLNNIVSTINKNEGKMSEFLVTLLVVYALDVLRRKLLEIADDISTISKFKSSVIPRLWVVRDPRYRDLLSAVLMLDKVLNEQLEFARGRDSGEGS